MFAKRAIARPATTGCSHARSNTRGGQMCSMCLEATGAIAAPLRRTMVEIAITDGGQVFDGEIGDEDSIRLAAYAASITAPKPKRGPRRLQRIPREPCAKTSADRSRAATIRWDRHRAKVQP